MSAADIETVPITKDSSSDQLKAILSSLNEQAAQTKNLINTVKSILKDVDRQSKELDKYKNKKSRNSIQRKESSLPSGITKPVAISNELAIFLGVAPGTLVPRNEVTKGVSAFIRSNNLSDPENKQKFILDKTPEGIRLKTLLGNPEETVTYFNLQRYLKHHYILADKPAPVVVAPVTESPEPETPKVKKIVKVVKKKTAELTEE
uniref:DM2 domain-containing protein n=1 Tax=viral metagenome TaxID=1070528 RepID=A0A6C0IAW9_9ZZZZ